MSSAPVCGPAPRRGLPLDDAPAVIREEQRRLWPRIQCSIPCLRAMAPSTWTVMLRDARLGGYSRINRNCRAGTAVRPHEDAAHAYRAHGTRQIARLDDAREAVINSRSRCRPNSPYSSASRSRSADRLLDCASATWPSRGLRLGSPPAACAPQLPGRRVPPHNRWAWIPPSAPPLMASHAAVLSSLMACTSALETGLRGLRQPGFADGMRHGVST